MGNYGTARHATGQNIIRHGEDAISMLDDQGKNTDTHSEYFILALITFPLKQWLCSKCASMLHFIYNGHLIIWRIQIIVKDTAVINNSHTVGTPVTVNATIIWVLVKLLNSNHPENCQLLLLNIQILVNNKTVKG